MLTPAGLVRSLPTKRWGILPIRQTDAFRDGFGPSQRAAGSIPATNGGLRMAFVTLGLGARAAAALAQALRLVMHADARRCTLIQADARRCSHQIGVTKAMRRPPSPVLQVCCRSCCNRLDATSATRREETSPRPWHVLGVRRRREDRTSISSHPLADLGGQAIKHLANDHAAA
jgi:hypothetical protein